MSVCNGDLSDSSSAKSRSVRFGNEDVEDEIVKVSTPSVVEAQPFNDDDEVRFSYSAASYPYSFPSFYVLRRFPPDIGINISEFYFIVTVTQQIILSTCL